MASNDPTQSSHPNSDCERNKSTPASNSGPVEPQPAAVAATSILTQSTSTIDENSQLDSPDDSGHQNPRFQDDGENNQTKSAIQTTVESMTSPSPTNEKIIGATKQLSPGRTESTSRFLYCGLEWRSIIVPRLLLTIHNGVFTGYHLPA